MTHESINVNCIEERISDYGCFKEKRLFLDKWENTFIKSINLKFICQEKGRNVFIV